eukprot:superscaffoldBa00001520_g10933
MAVAHRGCVVAGYLFLFLLAGCKARIHKLALKNETRFVVHLNTFGFYANGTLDVSLLSLRLPEQLVNYSKYPVGFSLSRSRVSGVLSYTAEETETCPLTFTKSTNNEPLILFLIDVSNLSVNVRALGDQDNTLRAKLKAEMPPSKDKGQRKRRTVDPQQPTEKPKVSKPSDDAAGPEKSNEKPNGSVDQNKAEIKEEKTEVAVEAKKVEENEFQLGKTNQLTLALEKVNGSYNFRFHMEVGLLAEGLYNFNFHYCQNMVPGIDLPYSFTVEVTEKNPGGYLSAAEIPLSRLYICMAGVFFTAAMIWVYTLMKHRYTCTQAHNHC